MYRVGARFAILFAFENRHLDVFSKVWGDHSLRLGSVPIRWGVMEREGSRGKLSRGTE